MKNLLCLLILLFCILKQSTVFAQVNYTANEKITRYGEKSSEYFLYGSNMAWKNQAWSDEIMGTILCSDPTEYGNEGPNANSLRPALYDRFVAQYGIDYRIPTFEHYAAKGAKVNTIFLSGPRKDYYYRDCPLTTAEQNLSYDLPASFKNVYEPIWITKNGSKVVNPENYYAQYVHDVVTKFKPYTRFWEIWNEPDLTYKGNGDKNPGETGNWWDADPDPCELHNLRSSIQHYIRLLRISYEVIKSIDPEAIVCTGGLGYASFLDAILRNTDNPNGGKVTTDYPNKGGAYFDCVSYHVYPMYYLREWTGKDNTHPDGFTYFRHTDAAISAAINHQKKMEDVLIKHGYNGNKYPKKEWILSETNIPSERVKGSDDNGKKWFIGSDEAQRNYLTKVAVTCQKYNIDAIYVYCPYDNNKNGSEGEYDVMGFYKDLPGQPGSVLTLKPSGKAWRTMVKLMAKRKYNESETKKLNLPSTIDGGAFYSSDTKDYIYVLWAKTTKDLDESASAVYEFPSSVTSIKYTQWDGTSPNAISGNKITLTGSPVFITVSAGDYVNVSSISLDKSSLNLNINESASLTATVNPSNATNKDIKWKSENTAIATVNDNGKIIALQTGTVNIIATSAENENITATCTVKIKSSGSTVVVEDITFGEDLEKYGINLTVGETTMLTAAITPTNATNKAIRWGSSNDKIAVVDENGNVTALKSGRAYINAYSNNNLRATCKVDIEESSGSHISVSGISLNSTGLTMHKGTTFSLVATIKPTNATNKAVKWKSSNENVVKVDDTGQLTALNVGSAEISAISSENESYVAKCTIVVLEKEEPIVSVAGIELNRYSMTLYEGEEEILFANVKPSNATNKKILWKSDDENIAKVNEDGLITALLAGTVTITAYSAESNVFYAECEITVKRPLSYVSVNSITLNQKAFSLNIGNREKLSYKILPTEASNKNVKWISDNPVIASVDADGYVTAHSKGTVKITIVSDDNINISDYCSVTVFGTTETVAVQDIRIEPSQLALYVGDSEYLEAVIYPRTASNKKVSWSSSDIDVVTINQSGYMKALKLGTAIITVTSSEDRSITSQCIVMVVKDGEIIKMTDVQVNKSTVIMSKNGTEILYTRTLPYNATNKSLIWGSNNTNIATVDQTGAVYGHNLGETTVIVRAAENSEIFSEVKVIVIDERHLSNSNILVESNALKLYPNPVKDELYIEGTKESDNIYIYSTSGQLVFETRAQDGVTCISVVNYKEGMYVVKIGDVVRKIIKK
ncbi:MAG: Ig-like domain-containing protein [Tannerella sp.]|nr:Ig-like domain-containing protein [Tannerella sp.]